MRSEGTTHINSLYFYNVARNRRINIKIYKFESSTCLRHLPPFQRSQKSSGAVP